MRIQHRDDNFGPEWAIGTQSSVCSVFNYEATLHAGSNGQPLLLTPTADLTKRGVPDGLRQYSVSRRLTAGNSLMRLHITSSNPSSTPPLAGFVSVVTSGGSAAYLDFLSNNIANQLVR